jgi:hypothetical protein
MISYLLHAGLFGVPNMQTSFFCEQKKQNSWGGFAARRLTRSNLLGACGTRADSTLAARAQTVLGSPRASLSSDSGICRYPRPRAAHGLRISTTGLTRGCVSRCGQNNRGNLSDLYKYLYKFYALVFSAKHGYYHCNSEFGCSGGSGVSAAHRDGAFGVSGIVREDLPRVRNYNSYEGVPQRGIPQRPLTPDDTSRLREATPGVLFLLVIKERENCNKKGSCGTILSLPKVLNVKSISTPAEKRQGVC